VLGGKEIAGDMQLTMSNINNYLDKPAIFRGTSFCLLIFIYGSMVTNELSVRRFTDPRFGVSFPFTKQYIFGIGILFFVAGIWTGKLPGKIFSFLIGFFSSILILEKQSTKLISAYGFDLTYYIYHRENLYLLQNIAIVYFVVYFAIQIIIFLSHRLLKSSETEKMAISTA
jgi:hypothetical protein